MTGSDSRPKRKKSILIIKANEMHCLSTLFGKELCMLAYIIRIYNDTRSSECQKKKNSNHKCFRYILREVCGPIK